MNSKPTLFYADDDEDDVLLFKDACKDLNLDVIIFPMGEGLLDAMFNPPPQPDFVFIDLNMPVKSGFEIIKEIKASPFFNGIPVVVLSTASDPRTVNRARNTGADYFITKASTLDGLRKSIDHAVNMDWKNIVKSGADFYHKPF